MRPHEPVTIAPGFRDDAGPGPRRSVGTTISLAAGATAVALTAVGYGNQGLALSAAAPLTALSAGVVASWLSPHWPGVVRRLPPGHHVGLTFDDGPHPVTTPVVLNALEKAGARATFFVLGHSAVIAPGLVRDIAKRGHTIGAHGWDHRALTLTSGRSLRDELLRTRDAIEGATGEPIRWFRPPWGHRSPVMARVLREMGWTVAGWRFAGRDWSAASPEEVGRRVMSELRTRDIVLLHDAGPGARHTVEALPRVLDGVHAAGLRTVTLDEAFAPDRKAKGGVL